MAIPSDARAIAGASLPPPPTSPDAVQALAAIAPVARQSVVDAVADRLRGDILAGRLRPGTRLPSERELSLALGVLHKSEGVPLRATFVVDPQGVIRHVSVNDLSVGRNVDEVLRVLDALQTDELCPCNWKAGEPTLTV